MSPVPASEQMRVISRKHLVDKVKHYIDDANRTLRAFEEAYRSEGLSFYRVAFRNRNHPTLVTHPSVLIASEDFVVDHGRFMQDLNTAMHAYRHTLRALDRLITLGEPDAFDYDKINCMLKSYTQQKDQLEERCYQWQRARMAIADAMPTIPLSVDALVSSSAFREWLQTLPEAKRLLAQGVYPRQIISRMMDADEYVPR